MHGGGPAHFSYAARNYLETAHIGRWMEGQKPVSWQGHSPDKYPLDFFHWRHLKNLVYAPAVENAQELQQCIQNGCTVVHSTPGTFQCVCQSMHCWAKLVWQCMANILGIYCNPNYNSYLLSLEYKTTFLVNCCIISWTELFIVIDNVYLTNVKF
jgi:hypothetical protein